jgi:hypothetical protein
MRLVSTFSLCAVDDDRVASNAYQDNRFLWRDDRTYEGAPACCITEDGMKDIMTDSIRCYIEPNERLLALVIGHEPQLLSENVSDIISLSHNRDPEAESYTVRYEKTNGKMEDVRLKLPRAGGEKRVV